MTAMADRIHVCRVNVYVCVMMMVGRLMETAMLMSRRPIDASCLRLRKVEDKITFVQCLETLGNLPFSGLRFDVISFGRFECEADATLVDNMDELQR